MTLSPDLLLPALGAALAAVVVLAGARALGASGWLASVWTLLFGAFYTLADASSFRSDAHAVQVFGAGLIVFTLPEVLATARRQLAALPWGVAEDLIRAAIPAELHDEVLRGLRGLTDLTVRAIAPLIGLALVAGVTDHADVADAMLALLQVDLALLSGGLAIGVGLVTLGAWRRSGLTGAAGAFMLILGAVAAMAVAQALPVLFVAALLVILAYTHPLGETALRDVLAGLRLQDAAKGDAPLLLTVDDDVALLKHIGTLSSQVEVNGALREVPNRELLASLDP
jgi:hypothetical protein